MISIPRNCAGIGPPFYSNTGRVSWLFPCKSFSWMSAAKIDRSRACSGPVISVSLRHKTETRSGRRRPLGRVVTSQIPMFVSAWNSFCSQVLKASLRLVSEHRVRHNFELKLPVFLSLSLFPVCFHGCCGLRGWSGAEALA